MVTLSCLWLVWAAGFPYRGWSGEGAKVPAIVELGAVSVLLSWFIHCLTGVSGNQNTRGVGDFTIMATTS